MKEKTSVVKLLTVESLCLVLAMSCLYAVAAFSADGPVNPILYEEVPIWLKPVMDFLIALPYVGPVLVEILTWVGVVAALTTGVASLFAGVAQSLEKLGKLMGLVKFAEGVQGFYDKVWPWVAWFSVYNVPKRK